MTARTAGTPATIARSDGSSGIWREILAGTVQSSK